MERAQTSELFQLRPPQQGPLRRALFSLLRTPVSRLLRLRTLNSLYSIAQRPSLAEGVHDDFIGRSLDVLGTVPVATPSDLARIPKTGPLVVVANHPFGVIEGLALLRVLRQVRPDVKAMANFMLGMVPEIRDHIIEVDPFGKTNSAARSMAGLKQALRWVKDGHVLAVFPAGEVASLRLAKRLVADPKWNPNVAGIIRKTQAPVLPLFFEGRNSNLFQAAGILHRKLRTVLLPNETLKQSKRTMRMRVGRVIPHDRLASFGNDRDMIDYLRFRTYLLKGRADVVGRVGAREARRPKRLAPAVPAQDLAREVACLPAECFLLRSAPYSVFVAGASQIPLVLREIGRLRELTFRGVGEGTGRALDLDRFDDSYLHLVLWNEAASEVAGAYRFARTDDIVARRGVRGLYTSTLFHYGPELIRSMGPALELGRSFVVPWHQKSYQPLLLLWKGLAAYVARNPRYTRLFGCVSISSEYDALSREIMVDMLSRHRSRSDMAGLVHPRRPPQLGRITRLDGDYPDLALDRADEMEELVAELENGRGIPVLLRQYLKLGGRILGFNEDPGFGNCLDGLIVVDLLETERRVLAKFMGEVQAERFLSGGTAPEQKPDLAA